jgi:hypothetical protein
MARLELWPHGFQRRFHRRGMMRVIIDEKKSLCVATQLKAIKGPLPPPDRLETIELSSSDPEFHRLPWEMARSAAGFLARQGVGFVRLVPSAAAPRNAARPATAPAAATPARDARRDAPPGATPLPGGG